MAALSTLQRNYSCSRRARFGQRLGSHLGVVKCSHSALEKHVNYPSKFLSWIFDIDEENIADELLNSSMLRNAVSSMTSLDKAFIDTPTVKGELSESESVKEIMSMASKTKSKGSIASVAGEEHVDEVDPFTIVSSDIRRLNKSIKELLGSDHPVLDTVAQYFFDIEGGKKIRPTMILLVSRATNINGALKQNASDAMDVGVTILKSDSLR